MAGEGQCVDRADCQVCLLKRLTALTIFFVIFKGLCISNVSYNANIGWYGARPFGEVTVGQ
jgi:hypothetical protein